MTVSPTDRDIRQTAIGVLAVVCLVTAPLLWLFVPTANAAIAVSVRLGIVLGALWLAYPYTSRNTFWNRSLVVLLIGSVVVASRGRVLLAVLPLLLVCLGLIWLLRPKKKPQRG